MRLSAGGAANIAAWLVVAALIAGAGLVADRFGFVGLFLLGALTCLICTKASLDQDVPTWSREVFKASLDRKHSPEQAASADHDRQATMSPLRFYGWCGAFLMVVGGTGFAWQLWRR